MFDVLQTELAAQAPVALATIVKMAASEPSEAGGQTNEFRTEVGSKLLLRPDSPSVGTLGNADLDRAVERDALGELSAGRSNVRRYGLNGEAREEALSVFIESFAPPPKMLIFGAVDFTAALSRAARTLGYVVTVCDARPVFATERRFPDADQVVVDWPHRLLAKVAHNLGERDAICVLTHDPKFDVPAIIGALKTNAGYIGAMGSRRTTKDRNRRLRDEGVSEEQLASIMAPIGLDLGARTPEETAISICAEIIAKRSGRDAPSLAQASGDIHRR